MSKDEIKLEINKFLDHLPDKTLVDILQMLRKMEQMGPLSGIDPDLVEKIIREDAALLSKLAR